MAFSATPLDKVPNKIGDRKITVGIWGNDSSSTGGDINTGLRVCENLTLQEQGTTVSTANPVVSANPTDFPVDGSAVTIVTDADAKGWYIAYGR